MVLVQLCATNDKISGYKPFVEACIDAYEKAEAVRYIPKLTEPRERSEAKKKTNNMAVNVDYLVSQGVRALPGRRYTTTHLQGMNWIVKPVQTVSPMQPQEERRKEPRGKLRVFQDPYKLLQEEQARPLHFGSSFEGIEEYERRSI